jgi:hypothetical protein
MNAVTVVPVMDQLAKDFDEFTTEGKGLFVESVKCSTKLTVLSMKTTRVAFEGSNYLIDQASGWMPDHGQVSSALDALFTKADDANSQRLTPPPAEAAK